MAKAHNWRMMRKYQPEDWWKGESGWHGKPITRAELEESLTLGTRFLLANQQPEGNFVYEYDWKQRRFSTDDNQVRQAGATWGLASLYREFGSAQLRGALKRSLDFWEQAQCSASDGRIWHRYREDRDGRTGTLALVTLACVEALRRVESEADERQRWQRALDGQIQQILHLRTADGRLHDAIGLADGVGAGAPSPYSEGEALLALVKCARYLGRDDLWPHIEAIAEAGYQANVHVARAAEPDSDLTKGYYQWSSMSWFEMIESGRVDADRWSERLMELAVWMVDTHRILRRNRNTAYAFEGLVPAFEIARRRGDPRGLKLNRVIRMGLRQLTRWQLGHRLANDYVAAAPTDDPHALGGIQNSARSPELRIDVAQHQMHALLLALRLWVPHAASGESVPVADAPDPVIPMSGSVLMNGRYFR